MSDAMLSAPLLDHYIRMVADLIHFLIHHQWYMYSEIKVQ